MAKERNGNYRRTILELVFITGIFAVISVFLLKLYLTADRLQGKAAAVSSATVRAESLAETVKALGVQKAAGQFQMEIKDGYYILRYDKSWNIVTEKEEYQIVLQLESEQNGLLTAVVYAGGADLLSSLLAGNAAEEELLCRLRTVLYEMN